ncbi:MAG: PAS domain S-box protein [Spirochaetales bacterium]|nr:PAS domain S-box protein [Spirochaetales bacterium]
MRAEAVVPRRPLVGAVVLTAGLAAIFVVLVVFRNNLPDMAAIMFFSPMVALFTIFVSGTVAVLAFGRYRVKPEPVCFWIGLACLAYGLSLAFYIPLVPGLFEDGGTIAGRSPDASTWCWLLAHFLFTGLSFTAAVAGRPKRTQRIVIWIAASVAVVGLGGALLAAFAYRLPDLVGQGGKFTPLETWGEGFLIPFMLAGAAVSGLRYRRSGERLFIYLCYLLILLSFGTGANILSRARYDFDWYIARIFPIVGFVILLLEFFWEYVRMYWGEQEKSLKLAESAAERRRAEDSLRVLNAELVRANDDLRESETRFKSLAENAPDVIVRLDRDRRFLYANPRAGRVFSLPPEAMAGKTTGELGLSPDAGREWDRMLDRALAKQGLDATEYDMPTAAGTLTFSVRAVPEFASGELASYLCIARDVTEERKNRRELLDTRNYLNSLLDYANAPIIVWNPDFFITLFNRAAEHMTGYSAAEVVGGDLSVLFPPDSRQDSLDKIKGTLLGEQWEVVEIPLRRRDGEIRFVLWNSANIYAEDGETLRATIAQGQDVTERLRAERSLKESEARYRTLFNGMTEGFGLHEIVCDEQGAPVDYRFLDVNPAFERLTGLACEDVLGKLKSEVPQLRDEDPKWVEIYGRVALTGEPVHFAKYSPALNQHFEVFAFQPAPFRFAVVMLNVTDRKRKEEDLLRLNRILQAMSDSNHAILRANDEDSFLREVCRIVVEDCGYAMVWIGMAEEDEAKTVRPVASAGFEEGYVESLNITWADTERGRGPTGTTIRTDKPSACRNMLTDPAFAPWREEAVKRGYASSLSLPLRGGGRVFGTISIYSREPGSFAEDETELLGGLADDLSFGIMALRSRLARDRAEEAVAESERRFQTIVKHSSVAFFLQDTELRYRWLYNPKQATADESVTGKTDFDLYAESDARLLTESKRRVLQTGESGRLDFRVADGDGERVQEIVLEPYRDAGGTVRGVYGLALDVTDQKRAEEVLKQDRETFERLVEQRTRELVDARRELEQSKRLSDIGTLAATVAHELRNPLAAINIASYNIARKADTPLIESHLATIRKKVTESDQIINNLLFYSRIKFPRFETTEVEALLAECLSLTVGRYGPSVTVKQSFDGLRGAAVSADPLQLREVFSNILNNAYDAIAEKNEEGTIEIRGARGEGLVKISVSDNGSGISKDHLERLFEPFFTTKAKGTGLGLAVCRQIVNLHGGSIRLASEEGEGTTVEVRLPVLHGSVESP